MKEFLSWLGFRKLDPKIQDHINQNNMHQAVYGGALVIVLQIFLFMEHLVHLDMHTEVSRNQILMFIGQATLVAAAIVLLIISGCYHYRKIYRRRLSKISVYVFTTMVAVYMALVSLQGYVLSAVILVLSFFLISTVCLFILRPLYSFFYCVIIFSGLYLQLGEVSHIGEMSVDILRRIIVMDGLAVLLVSISRFHFSYKAAKEHIQLEYMTRTDWLTGLRNRYSMRQEYEHVVIQEDFYGMVLMVDMDDFQYYNDVYGPYEADDALRQVAQIIMEAFGEAYCYRFGGDEFFVAWPCEADQLTETLVRSKIAQVYGQVALFAESMQRMELSISIGYTYGMATRGEQREAMSRVANRNLLTAKRIGKNQAIGEPYSGVVEENIRLDAQKVYKTSDMDTLTGLPNMVHFRNRAEQLIRIMEKEGRQDLCVLYFDVVNFKSYNQNFGFQMGDQLLKHIANKLSQVFPEGLVSRFASDHFIVLTKTGHIIQPIEEVHEYVHTYQRNMRLEIKAGIYILGGGQEEIGVAMDRAKMALDQIKKRYDADYKFYNASMEEEREKKQYIVDHLDEAMAKGWIKVYFQPVVRTLTGAYCGAEALARWEDPKRGMISPKDFIETLEEAHLIQFLDSYVLEQVCKIYTSIPSQQLELQPVSVNLSRYDFQLSNIYEIVNDIVESYDMPKELVHIEITESALTEDPEFLKQQIQRFHQGGYKVWMDDFGAGYSSLNTLKDFSFDVLKLDMMFLRNFETNPKVPLVISSIITMAKYMGIQTLAEGVETEEQADFLRSVGCEMMQGFLFSKPRSMEEILRIDAVEHRQMEDPSHRKYLDQVGRINLLSANPLAQTSEWEYNNPVPMAIMEYKDNQVSYINYNHAFENYLKSIGFFTMEESLEFLNRPKSSGYDAIREKMKEAMRTEEEVSMDFVRNGEICNIRGTKIALDEAQGCGAILITGVDRLVMQKEKPDTGALSGEAILLWLSTLGFAEILGYETYDEFMENAYNFQVDLTENRVLQYYFGQEQAIIDTMQNESYTYMDDVEHIIHILSEGDEERARQIIKFFHRDRLMEEYKNGIFYGNTEFELSWDGERHWLHSNYQLTRTADGHVHASVLIYNIEEFRRNEDVILRMANTDPLTGLYNRHYAEPEMKKQIENRVAGQSIAMVQIDLDNFKTINDSYGHECGDEALLAAADNLRRIFDENAIICRTGGDEFIILVENCKESEIWLKLQMLESGTVFTYETYEVKFTYSVGYTMIPQQAEEYDQAVRNADIAMYMSKSCGKGKFTKFQSFMRKQWNPSDALPDTSQS